MFTHAATLILAGVLSAGPLAERAEDTSPGGAAQATAETAKEADKDATKDKGVDAIVLPLVSYNSDDGFGFGIAGGAYVYGKGYVPYKHAFGAQLFFATAGIQSHMLRYDGPNFFGKKRLEGRLEYRREKFARYFGPGNRSAPDFDGNERHPDNTWDRRHGGGWARLRLDPVGPLFGTQPYVGYGFRYTTVGVHDGSRLDQQRPTGVEGGPTGYALFGFIWDSRNDEAAPTRGGSIEVSMRLAGPPVGSRWAYGQGTAVWRHFFPITTRRVIFAQRLVGDLLWGDVPFWEWQMFGGLSPAEGLGGVSSVRGLIAERYQGTKKVLSNSELRLTLWEPVIFKQVTSFGAVGFFDVGRAWSPETNDGPIRWVHGSLGAGARLVRRQAVVRLDYGVSKQRSAVYVMFGHLF